MMYGRIVSGRKTLGRQNRQGDWHYKNNIVGNIITKWHEGNWTESVGSGGSVGTVGLEGR